MRRLSGVPVGLLGVMILGMPAFAQGPAAKVAGLVNALPAREIGPANMGGRIVDLAAVESRPEIVYVAAATGGLWKTTDAGKSWASLFDTQPTLCMGAVAVAPSNPDVVWVGTGEANPRNSVSWGDGVYKSTDAGKTWTNMGLKETRHIGRVVIHPTNPDVVYVAALGHLWGPNKERGVYKTTDGGKTWQLSKYLDENTGFIDVAIDPAEAETLYAAAYQVRRDGFAGGNPKTETGPAAGLYKTTDGGRNWAKMKDGLPDQPYGRCGLSVYRKDPNIVYAVVQTDKTPSTPQGGQSRAGGDVSKGGIFRSADRGKTWTKLNDLCPRPFYYGQIRVDPTDDKRVYVLGTSFYASDDGGKTFRTGGRGTHPDHHAMWINPRDSNHLILGNDGGLYVSKNKGSSWDHVRGMALGQFYGVAVDMSKPYRVYGGLQDNGSWGGPSATTSAEGITQAEWRRILSADGFLAAADPTDPDIVYAESQYGGFSRINPRTGQSKRIRPSPPRGEAAYRFNWSSPMLLSPHDPKTVYFGGNHLFKSADRGDKWETISPDLTHGGPGRAADSGHTLTAIAESPVKPGVLYVGTDDGRLHVSRDGGKKWVELTEKLPIKAKDFWVTRVECSPFDEGTALVTIDRHRNDDFKPYLFRTADYGEAWTSLVGDMPPEGPVKVVRQSSRNRELLFAGTENGLFASLDGGSRWHRMTNGLPRGVAVDDLVIHPRDRELVVGTHGRSVLVIDVAPLEELSATVLESPTHLFAVKPATAFAHRVPTTPSTPGAYLAANPPYGAVIHYFLKETAAHPASVTVSDAAGKTMATLAGSKEGGLHRVVWNLCRDDKPTLVVSPGEYTVTLKCADRTLTQRLRVEAGK